uniref:Non-specific serine/threonine protein kinase n=1 Tax=Elaeophora elaphi TaxID=1147741 RepID=A0A0R3RTL8_9BILA
MPVSDVESDNHLPDTKTLAQSACIKMIEEFSEGTISLGSAVEFLTFVKHMLKEESLQKEEHAKLHRIIFGTAFTILKESMKSEDDFNRHTFDFALQTINDILENLKAENAENLRSFFWSITNRCLIVGDSKISTVVDLERIATFEANFVQFMLSNTRNRKELFSDEHRGELAFMVTFLLSKFCSRKVDTPVRITIGNTLLELIKPWDESVKAMVGFLPGICRHMSTVACADLNTAIVDMALKIFGCIVSTCLNDSVVHKQSEAENSAIVGRELENSKTIPKKNVAYIRDWDKSLKFLFRQMCSRLVRHQDHRIRLTLLILLHDVYRYCTISLASSIENILIDAVLLLLSDPYEKIAEFSEKVKEHLMHTVKESFINRLRERLYSLSTTIPTEAVVSGDIEGCLKQLLGVLFSMNSECDDFLLGGKLPEQLTFALSSALRLNAKRLRLSREVTEKSNVLGKRNRRFTTITQCRKENNQSDYRTILLDCISANIGYTNELKELTGSYHFAIYLLKASYTEITKPAEKFIDTLQVLVEQAVKLLERTDIHRQPRDDIIEDDNDEQGIESCMVTVLLSFCAAAFTCTPSLFLFQKLMNQTLFEIFKWTKSSYIVCAESAELALKAAALAVGEADVSSLCVTYGKYLLPKVAIRSRAYSSNLRTPCVLSSLLDHCKNPELFETTNYVVQELLLAVDLGSQEWLILILRAMLSFGEAIGKWFPDVRPQEVEYSEHDSDKKVPKPDFVESVNNVLKRTKHLLFSSHVPVRLLVLKILDVCLKDLQHFPDDYLPMIHENWFAVLDCLQEANLNVRLGGFKVVVTMCELSGSFCYRRFIPQVWPSIRKFMLEQSAISVNAQRAYFHSAAYKFQQIVLERLDVVFRSVEARDADWRSAMEMAKTYCEVSQPETLQNASKNLLSIGERKLQEIGGESENVIG